MWQLGLVFEEQEKPQAVHVYRDFRNLKKRTRGIEDPVTQHVLWGSALLSMKKKQYDKAEQVFRECLTVGENTPGNEHPETLNALYWLGSCLRDQRKYGEAEQVFWNCLTVRQNTLGTEHPNTIDALFWLGNCLKEQAKYPESERIYRELLEMEKRGICVEGLSEGNIGRYVIAVLEKQGKEVEAYGLLLREIEKIPFFLYVCLVLFIYSFVFLDKVCLTTCLLSFLLTSL